MLADALAVDLVTVVMLGCFHDFFQPLLLLHQERKSAMIAATWHHRRRSCAFVRLASSSSPVEMKKFLVTDKKSDVSSSWLERKPMARSRMSTMMGSAGETPWHPAPVVPSAHVASFSS